MGIDQLTEQELEELAGKAQAHYREKIRPLVYPKHKGRMLVIDVESLDYEIADRESIATERLMERRSLVASFVIKVGYKATNPIPGRWGWVLEEEC